MSSSSASSSSQDNQTSRLSLSLVGLLIIALSASLYLGVHWWSARTEVKLLRQELRTTQASLKAAQLRVEADQVIISRQLEMLRSAQETAPKSSP